MNGSGDFIIDLKKTSMDYTQYPVTLLLIAANAIFSFIGFSNSNPQRQIFRFAVWIALVRVRRFFCLCFTLGAQGAWFFRQGLVCELLGRITLVERKFFCPAENNLLTVILLVWW